MACICSTGCDNARSLRVWVREGCELHAVGKAPLGLHSVLAWQPNGRHLYAAHAQDSCHWVALFETNGLEHGGFHVATPGIHLLTCLPYAIYYISSVSITALPCIWLSQPLLGAFDVHGMCELAQRILTSQVQ